MASPNELDLLAIQAVRIAALVYKSREKIPLSQKEQQELDEWLSNQESNAKLFESLNNRQQLIEELEALKQYDETSAVSSIFKELGQRPPSILKKRRRIFIRWSVAASFLLTIGVASWYFFLSGRSNEPANLSTMGIQPGTDKAILTLQDGREVILDNEHTRSLGVQGAASVAQQQGRIVYSNINKGPNAYNTINIPRGGQYRLVLADGSEVWLNAASAMTYPTTFTSNTREVTISGEAYFKVAKDLSKPFIVNANGMKVQAVGTEFNVTAYSDEEVIRTTLVNGVVRTYHTDLMSKEQQLTLQPGEQAALVRKTGLMHIEKPNVETVTAWHLGQFHFEETNIEAIMRQISRWYDVKVEYRGSMPNIGFSGKISRKENIQELLDILSDTHKVDFEIKEDKIIVVTAKSQQSKATTNLPSVKIEGFSAVPGEISKLITKTGSNKTTRLITERNTQLCISNQTAGIFHGNCCSIHL